MLNKKENNQKIYTFNIQKKYQNMIDNFLLPEYRVLNLREGNREMGMAEEQLIKQLQSMVGMKDKEIGRLKDEVDGLKLIIKGMSQEYESKYQDQKPRFQEAEQRIIDFLRGYKGEWLEKDFIEKRLLTRFPFYAGGTIPRACRNLESQGVLLVRYEDSHPMYTINLKYDFPINDGDKNV